MPGHPHVVRAPYYGAPLRAAPRDDTGPGVGQGPQVDALDLLGFTTLSGDDLLLTETGTAFASADVQESKKIFAEAVMRAPLVQLITRSLRQNPAGTLRAGFFRDLLAHHFTSEQVTAQPETATDWGRYAELYSYDAEPQEYRLDENDDFKDV
ncbi:AAA-associated domain-containing protein [Streptomyces sp. NPDC001978]|uniref:AAA-associated domain-containing protein n=1 Tax=Streptomyces sp. NPDC001978 TaxID=3364627 RepID=UPI0036BAB2CB